MSLPVLLAAVDDMRESVAAARWQGKRIGFVPTMGALHEGHASLFRTARSECGFVAVSIFVNAMQFGPNEDFARYPRTIEADRELCRRAGVDVIFHPDSAAIYPDDFRTQVEVVELQDALCGAFRPGHFRGVCTVVLKLFSIVQPDVAYFGQKDAQQALILRRMAIDLNLPIEIRVSPTVREADGLAMSSRNRYLSADQRRDAAGIYQALLRAKEHICAGQRDPLVVEAQLNQELAAIPNARVDYARVVRASTLAPISPLTGVVLVAVAVWMGGTRLIDNILLEL